MSNMGQPMRQKRKVIENDDNPPQSSSGITDTRFSNIQSDPRYRFPSKRHKHVKIDKRFTHMLRDDDFGRKAKVDRYGRPLDADTERKRLQRRYDFEDVLDGDEAVQRELKRVEKAYDPIRDGGYSQASSSEGSSGEEDDEHYEDMEDQPITLGKQDEDIPVGEASSRIAVVNLDWDYIRAADLMAVFSSFLPAGGRLMKVSIYPSQFGKERMEREEREGPPKEIFASSEENPADLLAGKDDDEEEIKNSILQPDTNEDFDSAALRQYQLQRLQYFYAVLTFSSTEIAREVYDAVDGTEYLTTANFFDLRFIPDDVEFSDDKPRDECERIPDGYKPNDFVTDALQHSNVKLTWDAEDASRKEAQAKAFRGSRKDIDENDLKAYLGTDSSSDEEGCGDAETVMIGSLPKKEQEKRKIRALLGLGSESRVKRASDDGPVGDLQVTFSSGLSGTTGAKLSVFENDPEIEETTVEKYVRKERERKQKRKDKARHVENESASKASGKMIVEGATNKPSGDLGFDDPFFAASDRYEVTANEMQKRDRLKKRAEREAEEAAAAAKKAELELLMVDDNHDGTIMPHFDMKEMEKEAKRAKRKGKKGKKSGKDIEAATKTQSAEFRMDTHDPRFARLYENHEFAIDPTNPRFKRTEGMQALLEEGRKHRNHKDMQGQEP